MTFAPHPDTATLDRPTTTRGPPQDPQATAPLRVLLVDDCPSNRLLVTTVLSRWGIVPTVASDGAQAVQIAAQQAFDIVLMDILMPVMDGVTATAKIRQAERDNPARAPMPIVAYTSMNLGANSALLHRVGLTAVLAKPCNRSTLQSCLAQHCPDRFQPGA